MNFAKVDYITQMPNGIITVFGVYGDEEEIDKITGRLKLLWKPETGKLVPEMEKFSSKNSIKSLKKHFYLTTKEESMIYLYPIRSLCEPIYFFWPRVVARRS